MTDENESATLLDRFNWVNVNRAMSDARWARDAGLSAGFMGTARSRTKAKPRYKPDHATFVALAGAAKVSVQWLEDGAGSPDDAHLIPSVPAREQDSNGPAAIPTLRAIRDVTLRATYPLEDVLMVTESVVRAMEQSEAAAEWLTARQAGLYALMETLLVGASERRKRGFTGRVDLIVLLLEACSTRMSGR